MNLALEQLVWRRADARCEYCRLPQAASPLPHAIDHIIARQHRGPTVAENLALACFFCNSYKGPNIAGLNPQTGRMVRLFHPRKDRWSRHFEWDGPILVGRTQGLSGAESVSMQWFMTDARWLTGVSDRENAGIALPSVIGHQS